MGKLNGRELMRLDGLTFQRSDGGASMVGTLVVREDGLAFYKAKGGLLSGILSPFMKGNASAAPEFELSFRAFEGADWDSRGAASAIFLHLGRGVTWTFSCPRRVSGGRNVMDEAGSYINDLIRYPV